MSSAVRATDSMLAAGGKAGNLRRLSLAGLPVPTWAVISADVLAEFRSRTALGARLDTVLASLNEENPETVAESVRRLFAETAADEQTKAKIAAAYESVGQGCVAVRSSGADEDGSAHSFAGQYDSYLNVAGIDAVVDHVKMCWASAFSARSLHYRWLHDLPVDAIAMAVVLQRVIESDVSGVVFTADPVSGRRDELMVSAVYGLGEALVSGAVDADTARVRRADGVVLTSVIGEKAQRIDAVDGGGCRTSEVAEADRCRPALNSRQLTEVCELAARVETLFGVPQDIEWAIADDTLWLLQSRPITTALTGPDDLAQVRVWDNSNIIESYGEVTSPLTFSFARHVYQRVYRDYCGLLGVPESDLQQLDRTFASMLGTFDGRVYYNVLNWYKVFRLLPFYGASRKMLAGAVGIRETAEDLALLQHPISSPRREALVRGYVALRFARMVVTIKGAVATFVDHFHEVYTEFDGIDYSGMPGHEINRRLLELEDRLIAKWGSAAVLDNVIMLSFGLLSALNKRWLPAAPEWFVWEAVRVGDDVESTAPARKLAEIAARLVARTDLADEIASRRLDGLWEWIHSAGTPDTDWLAVELAEYLNAYGYRSVNELKLEEPDLHEDPTLLVSMLKDALGRVGVAESAPADASRADDYLDAHLHGVRRWLYERVRVKLREALRERERVRFARTRAFGMARRMLKAIGEDMARVGALGDRTDIFYLKLEEIRASYAGTINHRELRPLAALRRTQQAKQRLMPAPPPRFRTEGGVFWTQVRPDNAPDPAHDTDAASDTLQGTPCSPGVVTAKARVVDAPVDVGGRIIVTYRTDPGWVGVLSSAAALLIERGSPLTHVAIVARELGVPTIVQIPGLTSRVGDGTRLAIDGSAGSVRILNSEEENR